MYRGLTNSLTCPKVGEIDVMKYADEAYPADYYSRSILAEEDAKSVLGLCKLKIIGVLSFLFLFSSCFYTGSKKEREDFVSYYKGIVLSEELSPLDRVEVSCMLNDSTVLRVLTNKEGYFEIQDSSFTSLNLQSNSRALSFKKRGLCFYILVCYSAPT